MTGTLKPQQKFTASLAPAIPVPNFIDPTTTLGDLMVRGSSALERLGVGADGYVLTANSTQPLGMDWEPAGAATQTPWLSDIDAAGYNLNNVGHLYSGLPTGPLLDMFCNAAQLDAYISAFDYSVSPAELFELDIDGNPLVLTAGPNAGPATVMTIDSVGVAINDGSASAAYPLDVMGDCNVSGTYRIGGVPIAQSQWTGIAGTGIYYTGGYVLIGSAAAFGGPQILQVLGDVVIHNARVGYALGGYIGASLYLGDGDFAGSYATASPGLSAVGTSGLSDSLAFFYYNGGARTEAMRITRPSGYLGIGTIYPACPFDLAGASVAGVAPSPAQPVLARMTSSDTDCFLELCSSGAGYSGLMLTVGSAFIFEIVANYGDYTSFVVSNGSPAMSIYANATVALPGIPQYADLATAQAALGAGTKTLWCDPNNAVYVS